VFLENHSLGSMPIQFTNKESRVLRIQGLLFVRGRGGQGQSASQSSIFFFLLLHFPHCPLLLPFLWKGDTEIISVSCLLLIPGPR
jgi:hypothetical protein